MKMKLLKSTKLSVESLVMSKSRRYVNDAHKKPVTENVEKNSKLLRKATEADKERKRAKARVNNQKKRAKARINNLKKKEIEVPGCNDENKTAALSYLHAWDSNITHWSFKKNKQFWLLRYIFSPDNISDTDFSVLLRYIVSLQGAAQKRLIADAETIIKNNEVCVDQVDEKGVENQKPVDRAREVLQILVL